ncbi:MAG: STAS domain-containing protein, partial [Bacteroidota bacterium]
IKFMDSSGLGAIITSLKLVATTGDIVLCGVEPEVLQLFKLTRMDKVFSIISCNDDPEKHFRNK